MLNYFLNPGLLLGLAGLSLPVLVHLLSRRRYDVVEWGAMQFLELGRNARRRLQLEQLLLMLLRMALIALIVFALARPWLQGGFWSAFSGRNARDVAVIVDGSYSMEQRNGSVTPANAATAWVQEFASDMQPGDSVQILDARNRIQLLTDSPARNSAAVQTALSVQQPPSGSANLPVAIAEAVNRLGQGTNMAREIVVITDGQASSWRLADTALWARVDEVLASAPIRPRIHVVTVPSESTRTADTPADDTGKAVGNFSVDLLSLSRENTVPGFPVRITTKIAQHDGSAAASRVVHLEVDGQRLATQDRSVAVSAAGEAGVEFSHRFTTPGSHSVSVVIDDDMLAADNRSSAVITVNAAIPVLLVDGDPSLEPGRSETFFVTAALSPAVAENPLIHTRVVPYTEFTAADLTGQQVVMLADVPRLTPAQLAAVTEFVELGGGVFVTLGDRIDPSYYNETLFASGKGWLPAEITGTLPSTLPRPPAFGNNLPPKAAGAPQDVAIAESSLQLPWLTQFRQEEGGEFHAVRFQKWWATQPFVPAAEVPVGNAVADNSADVTPRESTVVARLATQAPLLVSRRFGTGRVLLQTSPLDLHSGWNNLAARRNTFVPLIYEVTFFLAATGTSRNVDVGTPLVAVLPEIPKSPSVPDSGWVFVTPDGREIEPKSSVDARGRRLLQCDETDLTGIYRLQRHASADTTGASSPQPAGPHGANAVQLFAVQEGRSESDLSPLTEDDRAQLQADGRLAFVSSHAELQQAFAEDAPRTEIFRWLMFAFLAILVGEVLMTRRLVQGGHADVKPPAEPNTEPDSEKPNAWVDPADMEYEVEYVADYEEESGDGARMWSPPVRRRRSDGID